MRSSRRGVGSNRVEGCPLVKVKFFGILFYKNSQFCSECGNFSTSSCVCLNKFQNIFIGRFNENDKMKI